MQRTLPEVRSMHDVWFFHMRCAVTGCFHLRHLTTLWPRFHIMIQTRRIALELPQILQLMQVGHCFGVPLLGILYRHLRGAHVHRDLAAQPEICVARNMDSAYRKVRSWRHELSIAGVERRAAAKLAKIRFRSVQNILETPTGPVLLVLTLCECR